MVETSKIPSLEQRVFTIIIVSTVLYLVTNLIFELDSGGIHSNLFRIYSFVLSICLILVYLMAKGRIKTYHINAFAIFILGMFIYYVPKSAGPTGGIGYTLQNITVMLVFMTKGRIQTFMTICLAGLTLVLFTNVLTFSGDLNYLQMVIDYGVNLLFLGVFMVIFKHIFDGEREKIVRNNSKIEELNSQLKNQSIDLENTNLEIQTIRDNLQQTILERTQELEEDNQKLIEYSFINAHLIRAPLTNIAGAVQLKSQDPDLKGIGEGITEMDQVLKKIADVLK